MVLPKRFSGIPRRKILLTMVEDMYWRLAKKSGNKTVQGLILTVLEGYLSSDKIRETAVRRLSKHGGSLVITPPIEFARKLNWKAGTHLLITLDDKQLRLIIEGVASVETSSGTINIK